MLCSSMSASWLNGTPLNWLRPIQKGAAALALLAVMAATLAVSAASAAVDWERDAYCLPWRVLQAMKRLPTVDAEFCSERRDVWRVRGRFDVEYVGRQATAVVRIASQEEVMSPDRAGYPSSIVPVHRRLLKQGTPTIPTHIPHTAHPA